MERLGGGAEQSPELGAVDVRRSTHFESGGFAFSPILEIGRMLDTSPVREQPALSLSFSGGENCAHCPLCSRLGAFRTGR